MYDPSTGRWMSVDPIGFDAGDYDLYRYVGNSPTNAVDPSGLKLVVGGHEIKDVKDKKLEEIIKTFIKAPYEQELKAGLEILDTMMQSPVEKKTYTYTSVNDIEKEIKLRLLIIIGAKEAARGADVGRLLYPSDNTVARFDASKYWETKKVDYKGRKLEGIVLKKDISPTKGIDTIASEAKPGKPVIADCSSSVMISVLTGFSYYMGSAFDNLFADKPLIIAGPYGLDRFITFPKADEKHDLLPGDTRVFFSPGAKRDDLKSENSIYLGEDKYYAPGVGIKTFDQLKRWLGDKERSFTGIVIPATSFGKVIVPK